MSITPEVNQRLHGFQVTAIRPSAEMGGRGVWMEHCKTRARLFWMDNGAENKVFSITFRTIPEDDTGVFHILEHSVLCGSERFPVREPFVELMKGSMNTFLNAMTFPDMTMYPVASRNDRDLLNLAEVYLDAVFAPVCAREEKVFRQEGWRLETPEGGTPLFKGVVYNEMKGALSDADGLINLQMIRRLFPDTSYGFIAGGDPEKMPELTYEQFQSQYHRFYHPSNAWIYLDGTVPLEELLAMLDGYLSRYTLREDFPTVSMQEQVASETWMTYDLAQEEDPKDKGFLAMSRVMGSWRDRAENIAMSIIGEVLTGNNEAPMKRAALERGLCQDLSLMVDDTAYQSWITLQADWVTDGREQELLELLRETGERVQREGIDRDFAEACLNRFVYNLREEDEPQGISRCIRAMGYWTYGGDPLEGLESEALVARLREMLAEGAFDKLATDMLLNWEQATVVHARPSHTLGEEKRAAEALRAAEMAARKSGEEAERNRRVLSAMEAWQHTPDTEAALKSLPMLSLKDMDVPPPRPETHVREMDGAQVVTHRVNCNDLVYLKLYFPLTDLNREDLIRMNQLTGLMGRVATAEHDAGALQQEIRRYTGGLGASVIILTPRDDRETCIPMMVAGVSSLRENAERAAELLLEVLTTSRLDETDRIQELAQQSDLGTRQRIIRYGQAVGTRQTLSSFSADMVARNLLDGAPGIRWIHAFAEEPEEELIRMRALHERLIGNMLGRRRMTVSISENAPVDLSALIRGFPEGTAAPERAAFPLEPRVPTGFRIPSQTGFAVQGWNLGEADLRFNGSLWLAAGILSLECLWNRVRVQGGAYGAGLSVDRSGGMYTYSYRDPTPQRTLRVNRELAASLRTFARSGEKLDRYILSALNDLNPLMSPRDRCALLDAWHLTNYTWEQSEEFRSQVLRTTPKDLLLWSDVLETFAEKGLICVLGPEETLSAFEGLTVSDL